MKKIAVFTLFVSILMACTVDDSDPRYDSRNKVVGYYDVEEYSQTFNDVTYYTMRVSKSGYNNEIYLNNFYAVDLRVYAVLNYDQITIPFQVVDGYEIDGTGTVYGAEIRLDYRVKDRVGNARTDYCQTVARYNY